MAFPTTSNNAGAKSGDPEESVSSINSVINETRSENLSGESLSTTSGKGTTKNGESSDSDKIQLAKKESAQVLRLRLLVFLVLLLAAGEFMHYTT
jgi:hypothetical protein